MFLEDCRPEKNFFLHAEGLSPKYIHPKTNKLLKFSYNLQKFHCKITHDYIKNAKNGLNFTRDTKKFTRPFIVWLYLFPGLGHKS